MARGDPSDQGHASAHCPGGEGGQTTQGANREETRVLATMKMEGGKEGDGVNQHLSVTINFHTWQTSPLANSILLLLK